MAQPADLLYSKEHEWLKMDGDTALVGITDYAQNSLGDIVYVELPRVGQAIEQHASIGVVESVTASSDVITFQPFAARRSFGRTPRSRTTKTR